MVTLVTNVDWLVLEAVVRALIGIGFIGVAVQLVLIRWQLSNALLFSRTILIISAFIGICGAARLASSAHLLHLLLAPHCTSGVYEWIEASLDTLSALSGVATAVSMAPLTLNAFGWHIQLGRL